MVIKTEAEFLQYQRLMHETVLTLLKLGVELKGKESSVERSVMENWMIVAETVRSKPSFPQGMSEFSVATLSAYYMSHKLKELFQNNNNGNTHTQYEYFQAIYDILKVHPTENPGSLKKELSECLNKFCGNGAQAFIQTMIPAVKLFHEAYAPIKGWICSVKSWETPSKEKGLPEEHLCDFINPDESIPLRSMAHVLEHIVKETRRKSGDIQKTLTIEDIQNELVHAGLNFGEKSHPHYAWGSLFALPQLFDFEKERVLTWYLIDKIAKSLQIKGYAENETITDEHRQAQISIIEGDFQALLSIIKRHENNLHHPNFYKECAAFLHAIKKERGFNEKQIFNWSRGLRDLVALYDVCEKHRPKPPSIVLGERELPLRFLDHSGFEITDTDELAREKIRWSRLLQTGNTQKGSDGILKLLVVGDSVSAGLRIPHHRKNERWVAQLQRLLTEAGLPVKVINCSVSGFETAEGLEALPQYLEFFKPDMVVCPLGGNDARKGRDLFRVLENMEAFVRVCGRHDIPPQHIIWGAGIPETFPVCQGYRNTFLGALREFERRTGAKGVPLPEYILSEKYMDDDKLHFNVDIQKDIAEFAYGAVEPIARELLERKKRQMLHDREATGTREGLPQSPTLEGLPQSTTFMLQYPGATAQTMEEIWLNLGQDEREEVARTYSFNNNRNN